ncbi:MAG: heme o synthase, partial [Actinomycetota bacterium]
MSRFSKLALATTVTSVVLITVGALVRGTGSGLGCPDWPRCHGSWIPPLQLHALIEYSHRLVALVLGLLVLILAIPAWARWRSQAGVFWPSFAALVIVVFQGGLGRLVVERELEARLVVLHFATSLALLGLLVLTTVNSVFPRGGRMTRLARESFLVTAVALSAAILGAYVVQANASLAFSDWPLMDGRLLPRLDRPEELIHFLHRLAALALGIGVVYLTVRMQRGGRDRLPVILARSSLALWVAQVAIGAANVFSRTAAWAVVAHVLGGAALWGMTLALSVVSYRRPRSHEEDAEARREPTDLGRKVKAYFLLTKPRVVELLLITTVPAMVAAAEGWPPLSMLLATLIGGSLAAGGAGAINCYLERDLDARMERTSSRPIPRGEIEPRAALVFGIVLGAVSFAWLGFLVNLLAAALALCALLFYVFVYTILLKRNTPSNIVIGGAAGAAPVLVGWAAVTGKVQIPALVMFAIIFYWTPPHFWALSLRYSADYEAAGVPMLPVVRGVARTTR